MQVSILSERRVYHPYGLAGGEDAECGLNIWVRKIETTNAERSDRYLTRNSGDDKDEDEARDEVEYEERRINLGGKNTAAMKAGERIIVCTPGGGGWGKVGAERSVREGMDPKKAWRGGSHASREELALQA